MSESEAQNALRETLPKIGSFMGIKALDPEDKTQTDSTCSGVLYNNGVLSFNYFFKAGGRRGDFSSIIHDAQVTVVIGRNELIFPLQGKC